MAALTAQIISQNGEKKDFLYSVGEGDGPRGHGQLLEALGSLQSRLNEELTRLVDAEKSMSSSSGGNTAVEANDDDAEDDDDDDNEDDDADDAEPADKKAKT